MRIKYSLLPKLRNLTNKEMDFFLCIAKVQDISGNIYGVHYKYICKKLACANRAFIILCAHCLKKELSLMKRRRNQIMISSY